MITIDYHPVVQAVVESWKRELPSGTSTIVVSERELRELIRRLTKVIEVLAASQGCLRILPPFQADSAIGPSHVR